MCYQYSHFSTKKNKKCNASRYYKIIAKIHFVNSKVTGIKISLISATGELGGGAGAGLRFGECEAMDLKICTQLLDLCVCVCV